MRVYPLIFLMLLGTLISCASHPEPGTEQAGGDSFGGEAPPCSECAKQGDMKLAVVDSLIWFERAPGFVIADLPNPVGVLPFLKVEATTKSKCKFCHSYSEDALEFDFGSAQDSLLNSLSPQPDLALLMPGLQVPEHDSTILLQYLDSLRKQTFVDGKNILEYSPWKERGNQRTEMERKIPSGLRTWISKIGARWSVKSLVLPIALRVEIDPDAGEEGGFHWQILWSVWNVQEGRLVMMVAADQRVETQGDVPPDRLWSRPFLKWLSSAIVPK